MRLFDLDGFRRPLAILQKHHKSEPGTLRRSKCTFSVGCPNVLGSSDGFFGTIVEIVTKRWPDLRLEFDSCDENSLIDNDQIPFLFWSKKAWQFKCRRAMHTFFW